MTLHFSDDEVSHLLLVKAQTAYISNLQPTKLDKRQFKHSIRVWKWGLENVWKIMGNKWQSIVSVERMFILD